MDLIKNINVLKQLYDGIGSWLIHEICFCLRSGVTSGITCCTDVSMWFKFSFCVFSNRDLVDEAKDYHLMPERRPHLPAYKTRQRCCTSIAGLIYAVGGLNSAGVFLLLLFLLHLLRFTEATKRRLENPPSAP